MGHPKEAPPSEQCRPNMDEDDEGNPCYPEHATESFKEYIRMLRNGTIVIGKPPPELT